MAFDRTRRFASVGAALPALLLVFAGLSGCGGAEAQPQASAALTRLQENSPASAAQAPFRFFSPTAIWNRTVPKKAKLDPSSARVVRALDSVVTAEEATGKGPNIVTTRWSVPIYTVPANQPTVRVVHDNGKGTHGENLQAAWNAVPLPSNAQPAAGTDQHLVVWQPSTDKLWEFWRLEHGSQGWHAGWGGAMMNVSSDPGVYGPWAWPGATLAWGATASSLSLAGGLITLEEWERGVINHALAIAVPDVRAGVYSLPAHRTDGESTNPFALPEGAHLRLSPKLNLANMGLPRPTLMLARAAKRYGIFVRSKAGLIDFYAQDPTPTGANPYIGQSGYFGGLAPTQIMARFPWRHLQLLKMRIRPYSRH